MSLDLEHELEHERSKRANCVSQTDNEQIDDLCKEWMERLRSLHKRSMYNYIAAGKLACLHACMQLLQQQQQCFPYKLGMRTSNRTRKPSLRNTVSLTHRDTPKTSNANTNSESKRNAAVPYLTYTIFPRTTPSSMTPLPHRNPHLNVMALLPIPFIARPIISIGRRTIRKIIQIQLPMHRRFHVGRVLR